MLQKKYIFRNYQQIWCCALAFHSNTFCSRIAAYVRRYKQETIFLTVMT